VTSFTQWPSGHRSRGRSGRSPQGLSCCSPLIHRRVVDEPLEMLTLSTVGPDVRLVDDDEK
jgi:hypothetical protein